MQDEIQHHLPLHSQVHKSVDLSAADVMLTMPAIRQMLVNVLNLDAPRLLVRQLANPAQARAVKTLQAAISHMAAICRAQRSYVVLD